MDQEIKFLSAKDGARIAYAVIGEGSPLVKAANYLSHLEFDWGSPVWQHWLEGLAKFNTLIRYDERGGGLSDWEVDDISFEAWVNDLELLVDELGLTHFPLLGVSQGGAVAIAYAVRHPDKVSHLILHGAYARGSLNRGSAKAAELSKALHSLMRIGWGQENPAFRRVFATQLMPEATIEQLKWYDELQRISASPENAVRLETVMNNVDVTDMLPQLSVPTLVFHCRKDAAVPFEEGRLLATSIPGARFVPLSSSNHLLLNDEPAWPIFLDALRSFIGVGSQSRPIGRGPIVSTDEIHESARSILRNLDVVVLPRFYVVGTYTRYAESVRSSLKDARNKIVYGFGPSTRKRENHLLWAPPGSGKTFFIQQIIASISSPLPFLELNLAKCEEHEFKHGLASLDSNKGPCLCLVDEIDAKPDQAWPYEILLPYLDANVSKERSIVFVMAGSTGSSMSEMKMHIEARPKGKDLLSRVPNENEFIVPPLEIGDQIIVALSQFRQAGREIGREINSVEKIGLYYVALNSRLSNARQLREFAVRAVERVPPSDDRLMYDHLFNPGDPENKRFWLEASSKAKDLEDKYVYLDS
jgi:pimeloyl-ACP methyl ester carboxylesterase